MNIFQDILPYGVFGKSRAINAENPTGEKGKGGMASSNLGKGRKGSPCLKNVEPGSTTVLADISGCGVINHIWITVDNKTTDGDCFVLRDLILRMFWDDAKNPAVEVPLGDFFCCGFGKECYINSYPIVVAPSRGLNSYFSMPFRKKARIELVSQHKNVIPAFFYQIDYCLYDTLPDTMLYFFAKWNRESVTVKPLLLLPLPLPLGFPPPSFFFLQLYPPGSLHNRLIRFLSTSCIHLSRGTENLWVRRRDVFIEMHSSHAVSMKKGQEKGGTFSVTPPLLREA